MSVENRRQILECGERGERQDLPVKRKSIPRTGPFAGIVEITEINPCYVNTTVQQFNKMRRELTRSLCKGLHFPQAYENLPKKETA
jgi:hypothetical protein